MVKLAWQACRVTVSAVSVQTEQRHSHEDVRWVVTAGDDQPARPSPRQFMWYAATHDFIFVLCTAQNIFNCSMKPKTFLIVLFTPWSSQYIQSSPWPNFLLYAAQVLWNTNQKKKSGFQLGTNKKKSEQIFTTQLGRVQIGLPHKCEGCCFQQFFACSRSRDKKLPCDCGGNS